MTDLLAPGVVRVDTDEDGTPIGTVSVSALDDRVALIGRPLASGTRCSESRCLGLVVDDSDEVEPLTRERGLPSNQPQLVAFHYLKYTTGVKSAIWATFDANDDGKVA